LAIISSDIEWRLSGGSANTAIANSTGGAMSTAGGGVITTDTLNNIWENVSGPDATTGKTYYKCIYIKNAHATITFIDPKIFISQLTLSTADEIDIGLDTAAPPGTNTALTSNGLTDPGSITWVRPTSATHADVLAPGNMAAGQQVAIWMRRVVQAGASSYPSNTGELSVSGETT